VVICLEQGANHLHMVHLMPLPPHHLLLHQNPDWFNLSGPGLPMLFWKRPLNQCFYTHRITKLQMQICYYPFCKLTSTIWCVLYLVEEHRKIEGQTKPDWMSWLHLTFGNLERFIVCFFRFVDYLCNYT